KQIAIFYVVFLLLLLVRAWYGLEHVHMTILTSNIVQSITFLSLLLQLIVSLPAYTLIIKSYTDDALLLMATTDKLTGTTNRHAFLDAAEAVCKNSKRLHFPVAMLFLDVDHFKEINDTYGHSFGDTVLVRMAALIDSCLRESDLSCRYGGEEFVMLLPHADIQAARSVAERLLKEARQARFEEEPGFSFTVSIGIYAGGCSSCDNVNDSIRFADAAMYQAKNSGRNQIATWEEVGTRLVDW
ncbi:MAG: GGDEF domain-containing protein, partial [Sporomusaceae bacterium]|nr:GGDEF domain-containing protein [Sporomusaceae bacterium]